MPALEENNEQTPAKKNQKKTHRKRWYRLFWWVVGILNGLLCVLLFFQLLFRYYTDEIVGRVLKELVEIKSDGLYSLNYRDIQLNFIGNHIEINQLSLIPNHDVYQALQQRTLKRNKLYEFRSDHIFVEGFNLGTLYFQKRLNLSRFEITNPSILIEGTEETNVANRNDAFRMSNLYFLISGYLKEFRIRHFEVNNGAFAYKHYANLSDTASVLHQYALSHIALSAEEFQIDSLSTQDVPFRLKNLEIQMGKNRVEFPNMGLLEIDSLFLSTRQKQLRSIALRIVPENTEKPRVRFPELHLLGVDFLKAYQEKEIVIDTIWLARPSIKIPTLGASASTAEHPFTMPNLYKPFAAYLYSLTCHTLLIDSAAVSLPAPLPQLRNVSASAHHILIDSTSQTKRRPYLYADSLDFTIAEFSHALADSLHMVQWESLRYNTRSQQCTLEGLEINPQQGARYRVAAGLSENNALLQARVPHLSITSLNLWEVLYERKVAVEAVILSSPYVNVFLRKTPPNSLKRQQARFNPENLYPLIENSLESVAAQEIAILGGKFDITQQLAPDTLLRLGGNRLTVALQQFAITAETAHDTTRLLQSRQVRISLQDSYLQLPDTSHRAEIGSLAFSLRDSLFSLKDLRITPRYAAEALANADSLEQTFYEVSLPMLQLQGSQLRKLLLQREGDLGSVQLTRPTLKVYRPLALLNSTQKRSFTPPAYFRGKLFQLDSGNVQVFTYGNAQVKKEIEIPNLNTVLEQFQTDTLATTPRSLLASLSLHIETTDYRFLLPDSLHQLTASYVLLSSREKKLFVKEMRISPRPDKNLDKTTHHSLAIPEVRFEGFELDTLFATQQFWADTMHLHAPNLTSFVFKGTQGNHPPLFRWEALPQQLAELFPITEVKQFTADRGKLTMYAKDTITQELQKLSIGNFAIRVDSFHVSEGTLPSIFRPLYSSRTTLQLEQVAHTSTEHTLHIGKLSFQDNIPTRFTIENVGIQSRYPYHEKGVLRFGNQAHYRLHFPAIAVDSLNLFALLVQKQLIARKIHIDTPNVKVAGGNSRQAVSASYSLHTDSLRRMLTTIFPKVHLEDFTVADGQLELTLPSQKASQDRLQWRLAEDAASAELTLPPVVSFSIEKSERAFADTLRNARQYVLRGIPSWKPDTPLRITTKRFQANHHQFQADTTAYALHDSSTLLHEEIAYQFDSLQLHLPDTTLALTAQSLGVNLKERTVHIRGIRLKHQLRPQKLFALRGEQTDWMHFNIGSISMSGFDADESLATSVTHLTSLRIDSLRGTVFRDKNWPFPQENRPPMPQEMIRNLPFTFYLDSLLLRNSAITYREAAEKTEDDTTLIDTDEQRTGQIQFRRLEANLTRITNFTDSLLSNPIAHVRARAFLMGSGELNARFSFDLIDPFNSYTFRGELDSMALPQLNPMLEKVAFLQIRSGRARRLRFWVSANEDYAVGKMRFLYNNLSISLVDQTYQVGLHEYILSLIANTFFIRTNNSRFFLFYKDGKIYAPRDPQRSVFNHWAKALLSGVRSSITSWQPRDGKNRLKAWEKQNKGVFKSK